VTAALATRTCLRLVDRLSPSQVRRSRLLVTQDEELSRVAAAMPEAVVSPATDGLSTLIGIVDGPSDLDGRPDDYIRERIWQPNATV
jgi:hypothetical protein